jgi:hypothetical protein
MVYQMTLQTMGILLTAITVSIAAIYYTMTLRYTRRNQDLQLETRQAQLFMQIYNTITEERFNRMFYEVQDYQWKDYDEYVEKYQENIEPRSKLSALANYFEGVGVLVKRGLIDVSFVDDLMSGGTILFWEKFEDVNKEMRKRNNWPQMVENVEYLYERVRSITEEQHPEIVDRRFGVTE